LRILTNTCATILRIRMWKYFTYLEWPVIHYVTCTVD
jgi:hypothetical protein